MTALKDRTRLTGVLTLFNQEFGKRNCDQVSASRIIPARFFILLLQAGKSAVKVRGGSINRRKGDLCLHCRRAELRSAMEPPSRLPHHIKIKVADFGLLLFVLGYILISLLKYFS